MSASPPTMSKDQENLLKEIFKLTDKQQAEALKQGMQNLQSAVTDGKFAELLKVTKDKVTNPVWQSIAGHISGDTAVARVKAMNAFLTLMDKPETEKLLNALAFFIKQMLTFCTSDAVVGITAFSSFQINKMFEQYLGWITFYKPK